MYLPYSLAVLLLDIYTREMKAYIHTKTCTWTSIAALFVIAKNWKPPKCPPQSNKWTSYGISMERTITLQWKGTADTYVGTTKSPMHHANRKTLCSEGYVLYDSILENILEKTKPLWQKDQWLWLEGIDYKGNERNFGVKTFVPQETRLLEFSIFESNLLSLCSSLWLNGQLMDPWDEWFL